MPEIQVQLCVAVGVRRHFIARHLIGNNYTQRQLTTCHFIARHFIGRAFVHAPCTLAAKTRLSLCDPCGVTELGPDMFVTLSHPHCPATFVTPHGGVKLK